MIAYISSDVLIKDCTPEVDAIMSAKLTFDNPEYLRRLKVGAWTGNTPKKLSLVQREGKDIRVPFGMLPDVLSIRRKFFFEVINACEDKLEQSRNTFAYKSKIVPYDYQEEAINDALIAKQGVIVAPCGSGKTQVGLEIAARIGRRTLWLTHTHDLLNQSMKRAKDNFAGLCDDDYGTITEGEVDCGNVITFATVQTMANIDLDNLRNYWDCVIVDECHHCVGTPTKMMMFYRVLSQLSARYKYGLTATPSRADGLTGCMFAIIGPTAHEINMDDIGQTTCDVHIVKIKTGYTPNIYNITMPDGTISHQKLINEICNCDQRNNDIVCDAVLCKGTCLILSDRVAHCELLASMIGSDAMCLTGAHTPKRERERMLEALSSGEKKYLISTYQLAKEGLDIPSLQNVIMATPQKNETVVTQVVGRVSRKAPGKMLGVVYDYVDDFGMLQGWSRKRDAIYRKCGYNIAHTT